MGRPRKLTIDKRTLAEMYVTQGMSQMEIAEKLGMSQQSISHYLEYLDIEARRAVRREKAYPFSAEDVVRLYTEEKITMRDIAKRMECPYTAIRAVVLKAGVIPFAKGTRRLYKADRRIDGREGKTVEHGYQYETVPNHPAAKGKGKYLASHRLIAEKATGRYLTPDEHVHHINIRKMDNAVENLAVMGTSDHARVHKYISHVAAFLVGLTDVRPGSLEFSQPVFWGGKYVTSIDLISDAERFGKLRVDLTDRPAVSPPKPESVH